jgi:hypothetical protein
VQVAEKQVMQRETHFRPGTPVRTAA